MKWSDLQRTIDQCRECQSLGSGLIMQVEEKPARPPAPIGGELLFISEAPPTTGGFWVKPPKKDNLRKNLFSILNGLGVPLESPDARGSLEHFLARGFGLLQTVKWPLCDSARTLRPSERRLVEHSVTAHLAAEVAAMRPVAVVALGRVACFACGKLFGNRDLSFAEKPRLEDVRGRHFDVTLDDGTPALIYP